MVLRRPEPGLALAAHLGPGQRQQRDAAITQVAGSASPADQIAQVTSILDAGATTPEESQRLKENALS